MAAVGPDQVEEAEKKFWKLGNYLGLLRFEKIKMGEQAGCIRAKAQFYEPVSYTHLTLPTKA